MRKELDYQDVERVAGGEVILNDVYEKIMFTTLNNEVRKLKNCTYDDASDLVRALYRQNRDTMSEDQFDRLVKSELAARNWI